MNFSLIPKNDAYFQDFDEAVTLVTRTVVAMKEGLAGPTIAPDLRARVREHEKAADVVVRRCTLRLNESFVTPIEREDILALITEIDDIADAVEGASSRFDIYGITEPTDALRRLVDVLEEICGALAVSVSALRTLEPTSIRESVAVVNGLEEKADEIYREALRALFARRPEAYDLLRWKEVYDCIENACDKGRMIARTIFHVLVRHS